MSAEVAILNKKGVALAADSAVTLGGSSGKIYNSCDKLFALSKYRPVGIMIYGSARFMGIDWETIIKCYRDFLGEKSFDRLEDYEGDFLNYLAKFPYFTEGQKIEYIKSRCFDLFSQVLEIVIEDLLDAFKGDRDIPAAKIQGVVDTSLRDIKGRIAEKETEKQIKLDSDFIDSNGETIHKILEVVFENYRLSKKQTNELTEILKLHFQKSGYIDDYSGIVIVGYGEREIFPSICEFSASGMLGDSLIYFDREINKVDDECTSIICPFAQVDMVHQFVRGIDKHFQFAILEKIETVLNTFSPLLGEGETGKKKTSAIFDLIDEQIKKVQSITNVQPILDIVTSMETNELILMADAMISLTALKRHVSDDEESVGGPVDVAMITKSDGFIWIKKKTSYDPGLNIDLSQNYFRSRKNGNL